MDNPDTLATLNTRQDENKAKKKQKKQAKTKLTQKTNLISNTEQTKKQRVNPDACEAYAVSASYKTSAI